MPVIRTRLSTILCIILAALAVSDAWGDKDWPLLTNMEPSSNQSDSLDVQYFKVGCILIRYGDDNLLTDPFFSSPPLRKAWFSVKPAVDEEFLRSLGIDWSGIRGILVGHGHYDHVLDAPYVLERVGASQKLYGSETVVNMLLASVPERQLVAVAREDALLKSEPVEVADSPFRFRAILSEKHAPLFWRFRIAHDTVDEPKQKLPRNMWQWKDGRPLAYLIDVMPDDPRSTKPRYRVYFQSSAGNPSMGLREMEALKEKSVDLAIISAASFKRVPGYPGKLLGLLKPKRVMIAHYERFWQPTDPNRITTLPFLDLDGFLALVYDEVDPASVYLPAPGSILTIARAPPWFPGPEVR